MAGIRKSLTASVQADNGFGFHSHIIVAEKTGSTLSPPRAGIDGKRQRFAAHISNWSEPMTFPVVYDVLMRVEIEAKDTAEALNMIADDISQFGIKKAVKSAFEIIRDDNAHPPKDMVSRNVNGFAVFTSTQKHDLVHRIATALEAAGQGNKVPGVQLLEGLKAQFAYLDNRELDGVQIT